MLDSGRIRKYLLYAIGEIFLVVVGILIALQINNWNNGRLNEQAEIQAYKNLKRQLKEDVLELEKVIAFNDSNIKSIKFALGVIERKEYHRVDSLAMAAMQLSWYSDFLGSGKIYETLVNSGEIKLMKNAEIPIQLQRLEMTYSLIHGLEEKNWDVIINEMPIELHGVIDYARLKAVKPKNLYTVEMNNLFTEFMYLTSFKNSTYTKAVNEISAIIALIDEELGLSES